MIPFHSIIFAISQPTSDFLEFAVPKDDNLEYRKTYFKMPSIERIRVLLKCKAKTEENEFVRSLEDHQESFLFVND